MAIAYDRPLLQPTFQNAARDFDAFAEAGADIIKICSTGGVMSPMDDPQDAQYSMDELRAIV